MKMPAVLALLLLVVPVLADEARSPAAPEAAPSFPLCPACAAGDVGHYRIGCRTCGLRPPDVECCRGPHAETAFCETCARKDSACLACGKRLEGETLYSPEQAFRLQVHLLGRRIACRGVLTGEAVFFKERAPRHPPLRNPVLVSPDRQHVAGVRLQVRAGEALLTPFSLSEVVVRGVLKREAQAPCFLEVEDIRFPDRRSDPALRPVPVAALKADPSRKGVMTAVVGYVRDHGSAWPAAFLGDGPEGPNLLLEVVEGDACARHPKDNRWVRVEGYWDGEDGFVAVLLKELTEEEARAALQP